MASSSLIWFPTSDYESIRPIWQDGYIWQPVAVHSSLAPHQTAFIQVDQHGDIAMPPASETMSARRPVRRLRSGAQRPASLITNRLRSFHLPALRQQTAAKEPSAMGSDGIASGCMDGGTSSGGASAFDTDTSETSGGEATEQAVIANGRFTNPPKAAEIHRVSKNPAKVRLELNLEIEIELKASLHGDLTLQIL